MDTSQIVTIVVCLIGAFAGYATNKASNRAAAKDNKEKNDTDLNRTTSNNRVDMERDAYIRARQFDTDTITRQDEEIEQLRKEVVNLRLEVESLRQELANRPKGL